MSERTYENSSEGTDRRLPSQLTADICHHALRGPEKMVVTHPSVQLTQQNRHDADQQ